jgi:hypothetical protein
MMAKKSKAPPLHAIVEEAIRNAIYGCADLHKVSELHSVEETLAALDMVRSGLQMRLEELLAEEEDERERGVES